MRQEYALSAIGSDIRVAAEMLATEWPDVTDSDQLTAEVSLWLLDRELAGDLEEIESPSRRVWFLWAIADKLVRQEVEEYQASTGTTIRPKAGRPGYILTKENA